MTPLQEMRSHLEDAGLQVRWQAECSGSHHAVVDSLIEVFAADARASRGTSEIAPWTSCWPPTGCGATGCGRGESASSP